MNVNLASGSIDLNSLRIAGAPNKYITKISGNDGITVHDSQNQNQNFLKITSDGISIYKGGNTDAYRFAYFGQTTQIGSSAGAHLKLINGGLDIYQNTTLAAHLGYGTNNNNPYFTFGSRLTNSVIGSYSIAEGYLTVASGMYSHAEGWCTIASGNYSHAEGSSGQDEGEDLIASGSYSHAEGFCTVASGAGSHAGGEYSQATGNYSFAYGENVKATAAHQTVFGKFNEESSDALFIIGNGLRNDIRSNLLEIGPKSISFGESGVNFTDLSSILEHSIVEMHRINGSTIYTLGHYPTTIIKVSSGQVIDPSEYSIGPLPNQLQFNEAPTGNYLTVQYRINNSFYYSFGNRRSTYKPGAGSLTIGEGLIANDDNQLCIGRFNDNQIGNYFEIGNGISENSPSNAFTVDYFGNVNASGGIKAGGWIFVPYDRGIKFGQPSSDNPPFIQSGAKVDSSDNTWYDCLFYEAGLDSESIHKGHWFRTQGVNRFSIQDDGIYVTGNAAINGTLRASTENLNNDITITSTTGTVVNKWCRRFGNVVQILLEFRNTNSTTDGSNIFEGTLTGVRPAINVLGAAYYGNHALIGRISAVDGSIVIRNASPSAITIGSSSSAVISFTFIVN